MTKFKCKQSGNIVSFENEIDIASMRKEQGYEEVLEQVVVVPHETILEIQRPAVEPPKPEKKRGRPSKK